jgi:Xaa-Pro dipeptidase
VTPALAESKYYKATVYAIASQVSDHITFLNFAEKDLTMLRNAIEVSRVTKSPYEVALIAHANRVTAAAHLAAMRAAARGATSERELDAVFAKECTVRGCREQAYHSIVAGGTAAATLHYVRNDAPLEGKLLVLLDAGAELRCYAADVTRTFPLPPAGHAGGPVKFAPTARAVYEIVLRMQDECLAMLREGVVWDDVHLHAHRVAVEGLLALGVLRGGTVDEILAARTSVAFFPHGLGHYLGMDTHDTGGNPNYKDADHMFRYLRVRGKLPAGCVITVEPGVYFCRFIIEPYLKDPEHSKYIDEAVLDKYWDVGGVRIEDDVLVTAEGHENLTTVPKTVEEIERIMS